jgi:UDP-GlcNAc:undecaprenyl-phosphate/decaprenyl-phosphate GlcNAc-1-phosphate transferase
VYKYAAIFIVSLFTALCCTPLVRRFAIRMGVMDLPGERRIHSVPVPRLGGVAVLLALVLAFAFCAISDRYFARVFFGYAGQFTILLVASGVVTLFGGLDDAYSLRPAIKLVAQTAGASILMVVGDGISTIAGIHLGPFGLPLTLVWLLLVTNAFNLIDGLDGLASGIGAIVSATLFADFAYSGDVANAMVLAALCGALLGFLRYNFHPAQIFLGDSGALLIGFILAAVSIHTSNRPSAIVAISVPILALGLPLAETALTTLRRLLRVILVVRYNPDNDRYEFLLGGNAALFTADRRHIHHRLLDLGLTHRNAVLLLYGISLVLGITAFTIVSYRQVNLGLLLGAFGIVAVAGIRRLNYGELQLLRKGVLLPLLDSPLVDRKELQMLADLASIVISYLAAVLIGMGGTFDGRTKKAFLHTVPLVSIVQIGTFVASGLYRRSYRSAGIGDLLASVKSVLIAVLMSWLACLFCLGSQDARFYVEILDGYLLATMVIGGRLSFRMLEHVFKTQAAGRRRALIYGTGNAGMSALHEIRNSPSLDLLVLGFVDERAPSFPRKLSGLPVYGAGALDDLILAGQLDEVILTAFPVSEARLEHLRQMCGRAGVTLQRFWIGWQEVVGSIPPSTSAQELPTKMVRAINGSSAETAVKI